MPTTRLIYSSRGDSGGVTRDAVKRRVKPIHTIYTTLSSLASQLFGDSAFTGAEYNLLKVRDTLNAESIFRRVVDKYQEQIWKGEWKFVSKSLANVSYIKKRFREIAEVSEIPTQELFERISRQLIIYSNAFIVKVRNPDASTGRVRRDLSGKKLQPVAAWFPQPVEYMEIKRDVRTGKVKEYRLTTDPETHWKPDEVIHFTLHRQEGYSFGTPMIIPVLSDIAALRQVEHSANILVFQHAIPLLHFSVGDDEDPGEKTEIDELNTTVQEMPTYGHLVTTNRVDITVIEAKHQATDMTPIMEYWKTRVLSGLGVSAVGLGEANTSNRGTATTVVEEFQNTAASFQRAIASLVGNYMIRELLAEHGISPIRIDENRVVSLFLPEIDLVNKIKAETHVMYKWEHNAITQEELRIGLGLEPLDDEEREDTYLHRVSVPLILAKAGLDEEPGDPDTNNKQKPENQFGKKEGPTKALNDKLRTSDQSADNKPGGTP